MTEYEEGEEEDDDISTISPLTKTTKEKNKVAQGPIWLILKFEGLFCFLILREDFSGKVIFYIFLIFYF